jgi:hypothetical protein
MARQPLVVPLPVRSAPALHLGSRVESKAATIAALSFGCREELHLGLHSLQSLLDPRQFCLSLIDIQANVPDQIDLV